MTIMTARPKTKIVCTLGPATDSEERIRTLIESGMSIARLNLSHGAPDYHAGIIDTISKVSKALDVPVSIMVDVPGAKYRTGATEPPEITLEEGDELTLTTDEVEGNQSIVQVSPSGLHREVRAGAEILVDDGKLKLQVKRVQDHNVECTVLVGGQLTKGRGVTVPETISARPLVGPIASKALKFAAEHHVDLVALSMVTQPEDVIWARSVLMGEGWEGVIISKIEKPKALDNFDKILEASDGIMVARGDLGVQVRLARVPVIQKDLIKRCNIAGKPVITATQMLESMLHAPVPTRAEVTDVANAVFDGSDAIMLSGETSIGSHPIEAVKVMAEVAIDAEKALDHTAILGEKRLELQHLTDDAISYSAVRIAQQLDASAIVAFTESGSTAGRVSKYRPNVPVLAMTKHPEIQRMLCLRWGLLPLVVPDPEDVEQFFTLGASYAKRVLDLQPGDLVVLVAGLPIGIKGGTNLLRVLTIP
jgi:pyruvate kinase